MRRLFVLTALAALLVPASAQAFLLDMAIGVKGGMNGSAVAGVPEGDTYTIDGNEYQQAQGPDFYAMFGIGGAFGGSLEIRALDIVGLEFGVMQSYDNGTGWEDKNAPNGEKIGRVYQEQRTTALHFPIMAKASVPGFVRPTFGLGLEIIKPNKTELKYRSDVFNVTTFNNRHSIEKTTYTVLAFSFGLEIDLGPVRIPLEIRGGYNTGFRKDLDERITASGNPNAPDFVYDGRYQGHFALFTGLIYSYDLVL